MSERSKTPATHIMVNEVETQSGKVYSNFVASLSPDKDTGHLKGIILLSPRNGEVTIKPIDQRLKEAEAGNNPTGQSKDRDIER